MRLHKRMVVLSVFLLFCFLLPTGCSLSPKGGEQPVTINIWHVYGAQTDSPLNDFIRIFNETTGKAQGIQVEVSMVSNNKNIHKDILAAANRDPGASPLPDIFVAYPNTVMAMPDETILVDYRDYFTEEELAAFLPAFLQDGEVNGRLVCLPVAKSTELLYINQTAFDRFSAATGVPMSQLATWEGLYSAACDYAAWTDSQTPDQPDDGKAFFAHDFHFNYFQVGVQSLEESFFDGEAIAFGPAFEKVWEPYAKACLSGGVWLREGYAAEPMRTEEVIVSVASSAGILYFSNEVIHPDNITEQIQLTVLPCPVFEGGKKMVMQRGAGMCTVKSTPEREKAAITFLKWLTEAERNTRFAVSAGYMPVTQEAFDRYLPQEIENLTEQKYRELYKAFQQTQRDYQFYSAPQLGSYLETENAFEDQIRRCLRSQREKYLAFPDQADEHLAEITKESYGLFRGLMGR